MTYKEFHKLQEKYNKPRDPKQQEKYQKYERKIQELMKKPPNNKNHIQIGINEIIKDYMVGGEGYFYDSEEQMWCVYHVSPRDRSNDLDFYVYRKEKTENKAFEYICQSLKENIQKYALDLERKNNDQMTQEDFLDRFEQESLKIKLSKKGPFQILLNKKPQQEKNAVGYFKECYINEEEWTAYVIMNGERQIKLSYEKETQAVYMMYYWIQLIIAGDFD